MVVLLLLVSFIFIPSAVMDGIDLDIEGGGYKYYPEFITELSKLMDDDQTKSYLITGAPQCPFPDHHLGPVKPGTGKQRCILWVFFGNLDGKIHWLKRVFSLTQIVFVPLSLSLSKIQDGGKDIESANHYENPL